MESVDTKATGLAPRSGAAFPIWRCTAQHVNDLLRGTCRECGESRPCRMCGGRPARPYVDGMRCDSCRERKPVSAVRRAPSTVTPVPEAKPIVVEPERRAQEGEMPSRLRSLWLWCRDAGFDVAVNRAVVLVDGKGCVSFGLLATVDKPPYALRTVFVLYVDSLFSVALIAGKGTANLSEVKQALGQVVIPRTKKEKDETVQPVKRTTKKDTVR